MSGTDPEIGAEYAVMSFIGVCDYFDLYFSGYASGGVCCFSVGPAAGASAYAY